MAIFTLVTFVFSCNKDDDPIEQEIQKCPLFPALLTTICLLEKRLT